MRATSLLLASAAMLLSTAALAQQAPPPAAGIPGSHPATAVATARVPAPNPLQQADVSKIEGVSVISSDGKSIGDVTTALMQPQDHKIDRLVVHVGGVLGMGGRYVPMPIEGFSWDGNRNAFTIAKTSNDVKYMAEWRPANEQPVETGSSQPSGRAALPPNDAGK